MKLRFFFTILVILLTACAKDGLQNISKPSNYMKNLIPPKLEVSPQLGTAFDCVTLGCDQIKTIMLANRGGGNITIKKIIFSPESSKDFSLIDAFKITTDTPVVLAALESLELNIRFQPTDGIEDTGSILVYWESSQEKNNNNEVNLKEIFLRTRIVGNKSATALNKQLNFNYVKVKDQKSLFYTLENSSDGNAAITLKYKPEVNQPNYFKVALENSIHLNPGQKAEIPIIFTPDSEKIYEQILNFSIVGNDENQLSVHCVGTAISGAKISVLEQNTTVNKIEFGEVKEGNEIAKVIKLRNEGSKTETILIALDENGSKSFHINEYNLPEQISLAPMETFDIHIIATPKDGGTKNGIIKFKTINDEAIGQVLLTYYAISPQLYVSTNQITLPTIATGWQGQDHQVLLSNSGTGELIINDIALDPQSSSQLELDSAIELPIKLNPKEAPVSIRIKVNGKWPEEIAGSLNIYSNSTKNPLTKVSVFGKVVNCSEQCKLAHGEASCIKGTCAISSCENGWHDADNNAKNGCECREDFTTSDIGNSCATGMQIGMLGDNCTDYEHEKTYTGTLHNMSDSDLFFVRTKDNGNLFCDIFGDTYKASVTLTSSPPGLVLCSNFQPFGTGCGGYRSNFDPNLCGQIHYERLGKGGTNDSNDLTAWLMWHPDANPVCGEYTLVFRAM